MIEELLRIDNGIVSQSGQRLIKGLNLQVYKNEIHGLISDNIKEKQCILDILNGTINLEYGFVSFEEKRIEDDEVAQVLKNKVSVIENKSKLVNNLSVAENIFVVRGGFKKYFIRKHMLYKQAGFLLSEFSLNIRPEAYVGRLTPMERCMVELVKAYATGRRLIVCSDLTSFLSSAELKVAFRTILWLKNKGIGFIFIENHDDVLFQYSDRITVINHGRTVGILDKEDIDKERVYALLMGGQEAYTMEAALQVESMNKEKRPCFEADHISGGNLSAFSVRLQKGELVNILYQEEEICREFLRILKGELHPTSGRLLLEGLSYQPIGLWDAIKRGICFIEEDPISNMLFFDMSAMDNLCFTMSNKVRGFWFLRKYRRSIRKSVEDLFDAQVLRTPMKKQEPVTLQKLAYSKWLLYQPRLVVCKKPFSIADVHMHQVTKEMILTYLSHGISVIILTSNVTEAHTMEGRILQLRREKI